MFMSKSRIFRPDMLELFCDTVVDKSVGYVDLVSLLDNDPLFWLFMRQLPTVSNFQLLAFA
jgi:hypothetical protein